jgi:hypothetical protein
VRDNTHDIMRATFRSPSGVTMKTLKWTVAVAILALAACNKPAAPPVDNASPSTAPAPATAAMPAHASVAPAPDANTGTIDTYELTMPNVDKVLKAQVALGAAVKADPTLDPGMNISEENDAQYVARVESTPKLKAAIESAGISVHDYAYTMQSLFATMMAVGAVKAGQLKEIPDGVNPRNVEFIKAHGPEIEAKMKALGAEG